MFINTGEQNVHQVARTKCSSSRKNKIFIKSGEQMFIKSGEQNVFLTQLKRLITSLHFDNHLLPSSGSAFWELSSSECGRVSVCVLACKHAFTARH